MQRYLGFRNAKIKTDMSVFLVIENEFDNFDNFDNMISIALIGFLSRNRARGEERWRRK